MNGMRINEYASQEREQVYKARVTIKHARFKTIVWVSEEYEYIENKHAYNVKHITDIIYGIEQTIKCKLPTQNDKNGCLFIYKKHPFLYNVQITQIADMRL